MTTPEALNALADRVEREEPSRELDKAILAGVYPDLVARANVRILEYTTSLDAAVTLVPEGMATISETARMADGVMWRAVVGGGMACWAKTEPMARTAAALRARAALEDPPPADPTKVRTHKENTHG